MLRLGRFVQYPDTQIPVMGWLFRKPKVPGKHPGSRRVFVREAIFSFRFSYVSEMTEFFVPLISGVSVYVFQTTNLGPDSDSCPNSPDLNISDFHLNKN